MTEREMLIELERRIQLADPNTEISEKLSSDALFTMLNAGLDKFVKTRYSGLNVKGTGFEVTQKRIDDLRSLVTTADFSSITDNTITLPTDYLLTLGETAGISSTTPCWPKNGSTPIIRTTDVLEGTIESIDAMLENSLSAHRLRLNRAKPIRLYQGNTIKLYTDGNYTVNTYKLTYLRHPAKLGDPTKTSVEYTDLPKHTHLEIVQLALQHYMSVKGSQQIQVFANEVNTME